MEIGFKSVAGVIAGGISLLAYLLYNLAIFRGETKPNRATWWILTVVGLLILTSYYAEGARETIWVPLAYVLGPLVIAILSIKRGQGGWTYFDKWCLAGSGISVLLWFLTSQPFIALCINIFIDFLGLLPTIKKSYEKPESEDRTAWVVEVIANAINLLAVKSWIVTLYIYPVYLVVINSVVAILLIIGRSKNRSSRSLST